MAELGIDPENMSLKALELEQERLVGMGFKPGNTRFDNLSKQISMKKHGVAGAEKMEELAQREKELAAQENKQQSRQERLKTGIEFGKEIIGEGSLGRADEGLDRIKTAVGEGRQADVDQIIEERRKMLGGLNDDETRILRARSEKEISRTEETQRRRLQAIQNIAGVRGGTAASQQLAVLQQGQAQRTAFERDLILANRSAQERSLGAFEQSVMAAEQSQAQRTGLKLQVEQANLAQQLRERELQQFNLAQAAREKFGAISVGFGIEGMKMSEEASQRATEAQKAAIEAASGGGKSGGGGIGGGLLGGMF